MWKNSGILLKSGIHFEEFDGSFMKYEEYSCIEKENREYLHQYVVSKIKEK